MAPIVYYGSHNEMSMSGHFISSQPTSHNGNRKKRARAVYFSVRFFVFPLPLFSLNLRIRKKNCIYYFVAAIECIAFWMWRWQLHWRRHTMKSKNQEENIKSSRQFAHETIYKCEYLHTQHKIKCMHAYIASSRVATDTSSFLQNSHSATEKYEKKNNKISFNFHEIICSLLLVYLISSPSLSSSSCSFPMMFKRKSWLYMLNI